MLRQYFAQYLLNHALLTAGQVRAALEEEQDHRVKLGIVGMNQGKLTAAQVQKIHILQATQDKFFGEIAIEEGFLTASEVDDLLAAQENDNLNFEQALLDKGMMTLPDLERALSDYKDSGAQAIQQALNEIELDKIDFTEIEEVKDLYSDYVDLFLRALVRFMDTTSVVLTMQEFIGPQEDTWLISQKMTGDISMAVGIMISESVLVEMARRYSGEELVQANAFAIDSVAEFLNVTNGLFIVNLSNRRQEVDLEPQKNGKNLVPLGNKEAIIPIDTGIGIIRLIIASDDIQ